MASKVWLYSSRNLKENKEAITWNVSTHTQTNLADKESLSIDNKH